MFFPFSMPSAKFQFQYGAIERVLVLELIALLTTFQFQYGAIESQVYTDADEIKQNFNSSMVRLKA